MKGKTSVYIASGHHLLRSVLCSFLRGKRDMEVVGEAHDGETAYREIGRIQPQLVLLDIELPKLSGLKLTELILTELPLTRVIAVTEEPEEAWLIEFLQLGGRGYLRDCRSDAGILAAIQRVMSDELHLEGAGIRLLVDSVCKSRRKHAKASIDADVSPQILSDRERQILHLYAHGYSRPDIGSVLFISVSTVGTYLRRIRDKLNLEHKAALTEYAIRYELYGDWQ